MADSMDFPAQLAALQKQYAMQLEHALNDLKSRVAGQEQDIPRSMLTDIHARLHKLAGSGGTFGFAALSLQAHSLEVTVQTWLERATAPLPLQWAEWKAGLLALGDTLTSPEASLLARHPEAPILPPAGQKQACIFLIEDDPELGVKLKQGLNQFDYKVILFPGFADAEAAISAESPDVLVVDIMLEGQIPANGTQGTASLFARLGYQLPTIFLTGRSDFQAKLAAARAGGDAFLIKPTDIPTLAAHIERLLREREHTPYRVLIVDDDQILSEHYRLVLTAAGILAETISEPRNVLAAIERLHPDLVLMDLHMPECSGAELARIIRFDQTWLSLPIIYLSAEGGLDQQIKALGSGADDFLTKPISAPQLIAAVRARAARSRKISELMNQDSLTGLLKHASFKNQLTHEVGRALRLAKPLTVAMVDIDHFKQVNDTRGHLMGDQVIKTLGQLMRQRLRRQDSIGRYGGEEFAIALPECTLADAEHLLDDIRQHFAEVNFVHDGQSFNVTLSAGAASSEQFSNAADLLAVADAALYEAKHAGRNQVRTATTRKKPAHGN
ncbi:diguanylate cyclase domain-containing protein [Sulfuriferula sp. GW1]|uniref:diguanylate cyclase domain-containing protein n=1 Tax=Sulfuriferula sp. GW1 TaxID=3345111 RepID=UPI0039AFE74F